MFEIKARDACARICDWKIGKYKVMTPNIAIVVNPDKQIVTPRELKDIFGAEIIITNAYIIRNSKKAKQIEKEGMHKVYDWEGPIYTDSGTFQMYSHGSVKIGPEETIAYQKKIGSDIITPLDLFTLPKDNHEVAEQKLKDTMLRICEARESVTSQDLVGPIQGGRFLELRAEAAGAVGKSGADVFAVGGIVPLMERYDFSKLIDTIMVAKMNLPLNKPVHAFGCGHPMLFSLLTLLGVDLFDSAAYALYAEDRRYMTVNGTLKVDDISELPCNCPACSGKKPSDMKMRDIAMHNLYVTFQEIKTIRQAIVDGTLFELAEMRVRAHPALFDAYLKLVANKEYVEFMEKFDPVTKGRAFFYTGSVSLDRPAVFRAEKRLSERYVPPKGRNGYIVRSFERFAKSTKSSHFIMMDTIYGALPSELLNMYPFGQTIVPSSVSKDLLCDSEKSINDYISAYKSYYPKFHILSKYKDVKEFSDFEKTPVDHVLEVRSLLMYQYGRGAEKIIFGDIKLEISKKTGRLRRIYIGPDILGTIRAEDGFFIPAKLGAERLMSALPKPAYRVVVADDAVPFVREGKSVFSKFVIGADTAIRPYDEVLIVDSLDNLIGTGKCILNHDEMMDFKEGVAVKTRLGFS
ncbi:MAG: tRNA guanosine(15) transglycosylase TgtA [Nanohaloarchaea archaeon]|nr:tRNA guanosine(15) transglycosylase TgtA [Candidatus Nanohaloarchaea archaeon]